MSGKTFADPTVQKIVQEHFVFVTLDVDREKSAAAWFGGNAIPDT